MTTATKYQCTECTNTFELFQTDNYTLCEYCAHEQECPTPKKIEFYSSWMTNEPRAKCKKCTFVSAYWECGCDLTHNCKEYN